MSLRQLLLCSALLMIAAASAAQQVAPTVPSGPTLEARAWLLADFHSGQSLSSHNAAGRIEPASLTKLMTAYLAFTALRNRTLEPEQTVPVSERARRAEGSRMFLEPRKPVKVDELIRGMIIQSGNDACIALAEAIAGSEEAFVEMMNKQARQLGLTGTRFANSTGFSHPQHYSTAQDLATLAMAIMREFPEFYPLYSAREFRYNGISQANRNRLLWMDPTVDGMKTGLTENAGHCLIASAKRGERRLVSVVLGARSDAARAAESQKLLNYGFQAYDTVRLYEKSQTVATLQVWKGSANNVKAGFLNDLYLSLPKGQAQKLQASVESQQPLLAPIASGQKVGTMKLAVDGKPVRELAVVALESVPIAGIFGRGWDALRLMFR